MPRPLKIAALMTVGWIAALPVDAATTDANGVEFFEKKIRPVLVERCFECHSESKGKTKGGLAMDSREALLHGGDSGPSLVAGDLEKSKLIEAVRYKNQDLQMPPKKPLSPQEIADLETWVKMGAPDPREATPVAAKGKRVINIAEGKKFWSFSPLSNPSVPKVRDETWVRTPVDAFILSKLDATGLHPAVPTANSKTI